MRTSCVSPSRAQITDARVFVLSSRKRSSSCVSCSSSSSLNNKPRRYSSSTSSSKTAFRAHGRKKGESIPEEFEVQKLANTVAKLLRGVNVVAVGENEKANHQLSELLAPLLAYSPMSVPELIRGISDGKSREDIARLEGDAEALMVENSVHEQLSQFLRVSLATCGANGVGALARGDCWAWIFGMITIWVDDEESAKLSEENPERFPQREAYELADIRVVLKGKELKEEEKGKTVRAVLEGVKALVDNDEHFAGKKSLYTRMGCRGDWPILQAPEWDGTSETFSENGLSGEEKNSV